MKKASKSSRGVEDDEPRAEYRLDYSKSRPNRFAEQAAGGGVTVILEPDVARVFNSSESVNRLLRSVIEAIHKNDEHPPVKERKAS